MPLPALLIAASALVVLLLASLHLLYTFRGTRLHPRDPAVRAAMESSHLRLTSRTTLWKAWIGFNASHSYGGMLFGILYAWLGLAQPALLLASPFLLALGAVVLAAYLHLGWRYWFRIPLGGLCVAATLYTTGLALLA